MTKYLWLIICGIVLSLSGCANLQELRDRSDPTKHAGSTPRNDYRPIDLLPMYGNLDRQAVPELKKGDEDFIAKVSAAFGGRANAAKRWVTQAFAFYAHDELDMAMRRFNQAWLLDPQNPEVYWGMGAVQHDRGLIFGAYDLEMRAYRLGFRDASFLADIGRVAALRTASAKDGHEVSQAERDAFISESERYYEEAIKSGNKLDYIYDSWSSAKYWEGDYAGAWEKVKIARKHDGALNAQFLSMLREKMPEPQ